MMDIDAMIKFLQQAKEDGAHSVIVSDMCDDHCHERVFCLVLPKGRHIAIIGTSTTDASRVERFYPPFGDK